MARTVRVRRVPFVGQRDYASSEEEQPDSGDGEGPPSDAALPRSFQPL